MEKSASVVLCTSERGICLWSDLSYWGFIQTNVKKIYDLVFPCLVKWTCIKFYCRTEPAAQNFSNNILQNSLQEAYLKPSQLLFG